MSKVTKDSTKKTDEYVMGIDEAGRGPVLGSMVYGACFCPVSRLNDLEKSGYFDSKQLKESERDDLFKKLCDSDYLEWLVDVIPPDWMSSQMFEKNRYSLNEISHGSAMSLIKYARDVLNYNITQVYLDTVGTEESYELKLINHFMGNNIKFFVRKKADSLYPVVSAASIAAKVTRDRILNEWVFKETSLNLMNNITCKQAKRTKQSKDTSIKRNNQSNSSSTSTSDARDDTTNVNDSDGDGTGSESDELTDSDVDDDMRQQKSQSKSKTKKSAKTSSKSKKLTKKRAANGDNILGNGYPGDENTKQWLKDNMNKVFGFPSIVRFSWQTAKILIEHNCAKVKFSDESDMHSLMSFGFGGSSKGSASGVKRTSFYKKRNLKLCSDTCPF